jgi:hypothetical protein
MVTKLADLLNYRERRNYENSRIQPISGLPMLDEVGVNFTLSSIPETQLVGFVWGVDVWGVGTFGTGTSNLAAAYGIS